MRKFTDNQKCFVCGRENPFGLKLSFSPGPGPDQVETQAVFPEHLQGWPGIVHGGLVSTLLDEIMVKAAEAKNIKCVTGEIQIRFKKPALTGEAYKAIGKILTIRQRIIYAESTLSNSSGEPVAVASGKLFIVD